MIFPVVLYVWIWELDYKENSVPKNWCFWTVVLEKTLESPLDCKEIKSVNPKGNQPWLFIGRTDAEAETPVLWSPDVENWLIGKEPDAGEDWRQEEKGSTEDVITDWIDISLSKLQELVMDQLHYQGMPGNAYQGSPVCCSPCGHKELDMTKRQHWIETLLMVAKNLWTVCLTSPLWSRNRFPIAFFPH